MYQPLSASLPCRKIALTNPNPYTSLSSKPIPLHRFLSCPYRHHQIQEKRRPEIQSDNDSPPTTSKTPKSIPRLLPGIVIVFPDRQLPIVRRRSAFQRQSSNGEAWSDYRRRTPSDHRRRTTFESRDGEGEEGESAIDG
ncbi:unnamed protein product [Linum trigynum]|uniref:Uncharacterized protein n=1 Tax=Linum trigynum TaxID=586398 RepID=A0AAV2DU37_9ROSI